METVAFDNVKFEKEKAIARFYLFRRISKLWQIIKVLVVFWLISWSSARVPTLLRILSACTVDFSAYLFNHHVVFLIGNAIIAFLFMLCRQNDVVNISGDDLYDDYVERAEAAHQCEDTLPTAAEGGGGGDEEKQIVAVADELVAEGGGGDEEKQIVVVAEEEDMEAIPQCDDVAAAIEKATRQIKRFQRTQSERLKREIAVRPKPEFRRTVSSGERQETSEMETLSEEEFQRTVDAFIDKHWRKKEEGGYQLVKMT